MKFLNKILIIPIILSCFSLSLVYAYTDQSDCWTFGTRIYDDWFNIVNDVRETQSYNFTKFLTIEEQKAIITNDDINTAIINLQKYCCEKKLWGLNEESIICQNKKLFNENSLDSPYLFDHLFDVIMRRLNWLSGDNYIYKGMTLDDKWASRRTGIIELSSWSDAQRIINTYTNFRTQSPAASGYNIADKIDNVFWKNSNKDLLIYVSWSWWNEESKSVADALKNYSSWTLYDRYINACALTEYFYALLNQGLGSTDKIKIIRNLSNNSCNNVVKKQIKWEADYVSVIEQRSSNKFLKEYVNWYIDYLFKDQQRLENIFKDIKNRRLDVIKAVPELTKKCWK